MERSRLAVAGLVGAVVVVGVGAAVVFGVVPGGGGDAAPPAGETQSNDSGNVSLAFTIHGRSECGLTCRRVNTTVTNTGDETIENVRFAHELFTPTENGSADDLVWNGTVEPGRLDANGTAVSKFEITVTGSEGLALRNDGGILHSTAITPRGTVTFENVVLDG
jgi:hypothetical protein